MPRHLSSALENTHCSRSFPMILYEGIMWEIFCKHKATSFISPCTCNRFTCGMNQRSSLRHTNADFLYLPEKLMCLLCSKKEKQKWKFWWNLILDPERNHDIYTIWLPQLNPQCILWIGYDYLNIRHIIMKSSSNLLIVMKSMNLLGHLHVPLLTGQISEIPYRNPQENLQDEVQPKG